MGKIKYEKPIVEVIDLPPDFWKTPKEEECGEMMPPNDIKQANGE